MNVTMQQMLFAFIKCPVSVIWFENLTPCLQSFMFWECQSSFLYLLSRVSSAIPTGFTCGLQIFRQGVGTELDHVNFYNQ